MPLILIHVVLKRRCVCWQNPVCSFDFEGDVFACEGWNDYGNNRGDWSCGKPRSTAVPRFTYSHFAPGQPRKGTNMLPGTNIPDPSCRNWYTSVLPAIQAIFAIGTSIDTNSQLANCPIRGT